MSRFVFLDILPLSRKAIAGMARGLAMVGMIATVAVAAPAEANPKYAGIVVDAKTGKVLYSDSADALRYPASLTKMMTLYLTFEALEARKIKLNSRVPMSKHAASEPPTKLGVGAGKSLTVEQAILGLVTRSANDAATALAEFLGGSEDRFARIMTQKARALGMTRTVYRNAHGLPNSAQVTTARDQARLGMALRQHFPQYYSYFSTRSFQFGKKTIGNHNRLLGNVEGVDGIKTGYTRASGYNLVTSAMVGGRSVVGVVMGGKSGGARDQQMRKLIAAYLPKASTRGGGKLIAAGKAAPTVASLIERAPAETAPATAGAAALAVSLPENGPVPSYRYEGDAVTLSSADVVGKKALVASLAGQRALAEPEDVSGEGDAGGGAVDSVTTASTAASDEAVPAGWVIQIGATPDRAQAEELLARASDQGGKTLSGAKPFTVAHAGLVRARFGGFANQNRASAACKTLKSKGFDCWASQR